MAAVKILVIPGSLRTGSHNARLAASITRELTLSNIDVTRISLSDYQLPIYDAAIEARGVPEAAHELKRMIGAHHGVIIVSPEYNASVSPLVKNAIDWVSRVRERGETPLSVFRGRVFALGAASNGRFGGMRGLLALRHVLEIGCGALVLPAQISVSAAENAFDEMDQLKDPQDAERLRGFVRDAVDIAQRMM
jgi:chromate reductase, NAD(P)H dehydrogenase (quinone)